MNFEVKSVKHFRGSVSDFYKAKVLFVGRTFNVTYDLLDGNVNIHQWYLLEDDELSYLQRELKEYFPKLTA